ncbi:MAG: serine/threonine protein kinase [Deltaproteobacteria bacterium]|nr:serine/threonine protein kinase [Deltaproteobacteria bacterium]
MSEAEEPRAGAGAPTAGWPEDRPWSDDELDEELAAEIDQTLARRGSVLEGLESTVAERPSATIVPPKHLRTTAGRQALAAVRVAQTPAERLEVLEGDVLGVGGMSVVRRGKQTALDREVAVKELPERQRESEHAAVELLQEAWVTGRLEHPNVVPVYDLALDEEGRPRLVMKRIEGVRWTDLMQDPDRVRDRYGASDAMTWHLNVFMQVCHAIHFAHGRGVIHRDIKPDNVMVGAYGEVYVLDWGIAVASGEGAMLPTGEGSSIAGTPPYMAPEMIDGRKATIRTDVYLLGGLLYELVAGKPPHHGTSLKEIARKVLISNPTIPADTEPELAALIRKALARNPSERFEDAESLRRAVQELLERREARALAQAALTDLERLESLAAVAHHSDEDERVEVYDLFGACRFGFRAALARDPDSRVAREGLETAIETMVELELARGAAGVAASLLAEMTTPPASLTERVEQARATEAARRAKLERIAFHHDRRVATRPRWIVLWILTAVWCAVPLGQSILETELTWFREIVRPLLYCVLLLVLLAWKRKELTANLFNRKVWGVAMTIFAAEAVFTVGQWLADLPIEIAAIQDDGMRGVAIAALAIFVEPVLWIGAVGSFSTFLLATRWPEYRLLLSATANLLIMGPLIWAWRPSRLERDS